MTEEQKINCCFIRINTKELREKLEALGFQNNENINGEPRRSYGLLARNIRSKKKYIIGMPFMSEESAGLFFIDEYIKERPEILDCGNEIQLFLQICGGESLSN